MKAEEGLDRECASFYRAAMQLLDQRKVPFLLGGAFALSIYTGLSRDTKDVDFFLRARDLDRALHAFEEHGFHGEKTFPHWLAKIHAGDNFVDLIYAAGNGLCAVDDGWFARARDERLLGSPVKVVAPEEIIWMKAFVQERERFDGADIAHLLLSCAEAIDWPHLRARFGEDWRVLYAHLVLFGYIYPSERTRIPPELMRELDRRMQEEERAPCREKICRGALLSRAQYLPDVNERGYRDARLEHRTSMDEQDVSKWTEAIPRDEVDVPKAE